MMMFTYCVLIWCISWYPLANCLSNRIFGSGEPPSLLGTNELIVDRWFIQKLDHFDPTNNKTWKQRYRINSKYYSYNGPVFLMVEGEGPISTSWLFQGSMVEYAEMFNALCIQVEHRYYGQSLPTENMSTKNMVYLSSEQALADFAEFIVGIRSKYDISPMSKFVVFGGSYAGSLAAWLRMKYPHLVHAAVSSSSPLLAKLDFNDYFKVVENSIATYNPECALQIKEANREINSVLNMSLGSKIIENKFKLCTSLDKNNKNDVATLFQSLAFNFARFVQYNNPEYSTITILCDIMVNKSLPTPLDRYAAVNERVLWYYDTDCLDHVYTNSVASLSDISWDGDSNMFYGERQWQYQLCTEFGFYRSSSQNSHAFGHNFPVDYFIDFCTDIFGKSFNSKFLSKSIERTNTMYGGLNLRQNRIIYVHGSIDPWHPLGITETKLNNTVAIFIKGTSHCADMRPSNDRKDLPELMKARFIISSYLDKWLAEDDFVDSDDVD